MCVLTFSVLVFVRVDFQCPGVCVDFQCQFLLMFMLTFSVGVP